MKQICFFLSIIVIIFLSACQKDFTVDNVSPLSNAALTGSNFPDKIYLTRTSGTITDTVFTQFYFYGNNRRIISFLFPTDRQQGPYPGSESDFFMQDRIHFLQEAKKFFTERADLTIL